MSFLVEFFDLFEVRERKREREVEWNEMSVFPMAYSTGEWWEFE